MSKEQILILKHNRLVAELQATSARLSSGVLGNPEAWSNVMDGLIYDLYQIEKELERNPNEPTKDRAED